MEAIHEKLLGIATAKSFWSWDFAGSAKGNNCNNRRIKC